MMALNIHILIVLNNLTGQIPFFDALVTFVATKLDKIILITVIAMLIADGLVRQSKSYRLICLQCYEHLIVTLIIVCGARGIAELIKILTHIPRPFIALQETIQPLFLHGGYDSFPSGHATLFFALALGVYRYKKLWGVVLFIFALLISLSRVIAGVHYPIDIFAGMLLGVLIGGAALFFDKQLFHRLK